jgi:hypothetical protein
MPLLFLLKPFVPYKNYLLFHTPLSFENISSFYTSLDTVLNNVTLLGLQASYFQNHKMQRQESHLCSTQMNQQNNHEPSKHATNCSAK